MDIRYSTNQRDFRHYDTEEIRKEFLIEKIFKPDDITDTYSHIDRIITMGVMPITKDVSLDKNIDCWKDLGVRYFLERRELGIINIGGKGIVVADEKQYKIGHLCALYLPAGTKTVYFSAENATDPPKFYMCSTPAHCSYPATLIPFEKAIHRRLGSSETSNSRTINQFVHPDILQTCQLSMGLTILEAGSVWNTMPVHTHERRMEVYFYFDIPENNVVFHMMGEGNESRHIIMHNEQAIISPSWSIHAGCGTSNYSFIWAMAGENRAFDDMDEIPTELLR